MKRPEDTYAIHVPATRPRSRLGRPAVQFQRELRAERDREARQLEELARLHDIQTAYVGMDGRRHEASREVLLNLLGILGTPVQTAEEVREALREKRQSYWRRCVEPVAVAWDERPCRIQARFPAGTRRRSWPCRLRLEDGTIRELECRPDRMRTLQMLEFEGRAFAVKEFALPGSPLGYHQLEFETDDGRCESLVISAPTRSYSGPGNPRAWGIFAPLYAAHSERSWGAGNFGDWWRLGEWVASLGGSVMGTLPLLAAFLDQPTVEPSPYSPASRLFWNEFYLDIPEIPEFSRCAAAQRLVASDRFQQQLEGFRRRACIDYQEEMAARRQVLERLAEAFFAERNPERWREFRAFVHARPQVEDYAKFRAACDQTRTGWHQWPERMRRGKLFPGDYSEAAMRYHLYVQWQTEAQLGQLLRRGECRGLRLCLDQPLGVHAEGYDVWREPEVFAREANAGAPPDTYFTKGQDWGFAPLHPQRLRAEGYRYLREVLRFQMGHTGLLRVDHVMGLHRLYWVPRGHAPADGAFVRYQAEEMYALFCLESVRNRTALVGENLGTVPPEVNRAMKRHGFRETYVLQYELRPDPKAALRPPSKSAVASLNTHDMAPFKAFLEGRDVTDRYELGLIPKDGLEPERRARRKMVEALTAFLRRAGWLKTARPRPADVLRAAQAWLSASPAGIVLLSLDDLLEETLPQNVPGTWRERPNWRRKARQTVEAIRQRSDLRAWLAEIAAARKSPGPRKSRRGR